MAHPTIEAWLSKAAGRIMNPDGHYGYQCVDAVDQYAQDIFGVPWRTCVGGVGGARELLDVAPGAYWIRIHNDGSAHLLPQRGDVMVWAGDASNQWGHTAVVLSATQSRVTVIQQDGFAPPHQFVDGQWYSAKPAHIATLRYSQPGTGPTLGWLRPRPEKIRAAFQPAGTINTPATEPKEWDEMASMEEVKQAIRDVLAEDGVSHGLGRDAAWFTWGESHPGKPGETPTAMALLNGAYERTLMALSEATNAKVAARENGARLAALEAACAEIAQNPGVTPETLAEAMKAAVGKFSITLTNEEPE